MTDNYNKVINSQKNVLHESYYDVHYSFVKCVVQQKWNRHTVLLLGIGV